jgi:hypothetical protein
MHARSTVCWHTGTGPERNVAFHQPCSPAAHACANAVLTSAELHMPGQEASSLASSTDGLARPFLDAIGLDVYAVAFRVAGFDGQEQLISLTQHDLDRIQWQSHIPILPAHRQRILEASRCCAALQVSQPYCSCCCCCCCCRSSQLVASTALNIFITLAAVM